MNLKEALDIVVQLAEQNILEDCDDEDQEEMQADQNEACDVVRKYMETL